MFRNINKITFNVMELMVVMSICSMLASVILVTELGPGERTIEAAVVKASI